MSLTIAEVVSSKTSIVLYGMPLKDLALGTGLGLDMEQKGPIGFALIRAFSISGFCTTLPTQIILAVPGDGIDADPSDPCAKKDEKTWRIRNIEETLIIDIQRGKLVELLEDAETRGISGGITIENPSISNGRICGTAHIWYEIEIFGGRVKDDKRVDFCLPLEGCHQILEFGIGHIEACVSPSNSGINICAKLCVGKWGLSKCWDYCTNIGIGRIPTGSECDCKTS